MIWMLLEKGVSTGDDDGFAVYFEPLDGDIDKVETFDTSIDIGNWALLPSEAFASGRRVHEEHLPTRIRPSLSRGHPKKSAVNLPDYFDVEHGQAVSDRFRQIVERLEPDTHQFVPVDLVWKSGEVVETPYFWFIPTVRLFALDPEQTTPELTEAGFFRISTSTDDWGMVFRSSIVANHHVFCTGEMSDYIFITDALKTALEEAGIKGARYRGPYQES